MALAYVLDEHLRGPLWRAIDGHNRAGIDKIDVVRVGDVQGFPFGVTDAVILAWAEREQRVLVSLDRSTLPIHLENHIQNGHHSPGVFLVRRTATISDVLHFLVLAAHTSFPAEWVNRVEYVPF